MSQTPTSPSLDTSAGIRPADHQDNVADGLRMQIVMRQLFAQESTPIRLGRYAILEKLGEGGMGVVFAAYDNDLDRKVALKLVRVDPNIPRPQRTQGLRVLREAKALARLSHPNIVQVYEVNEAEGQLFIAMEYIRGQTLTQWIHSRADAPSRTWREVVAMFLPLAHGLAAAHQVGVVHRDFKPANVLICDREGRPRLVDFGLARGLDTGHSEPSPDNSRPLSGLTATGAIVGTLGYMSPEQCRGEDIDPRADQFAFCSALYEALVGVRPFPITSLKAYKQAIEAGPSLPADIPKRLRAVLARGLHPQPCERYPDMQALATALAADPWQVVSQLAARLALILLAGLIVYTIFLWTRPGVVSISVAVAPGFESAAKVTMAGQQLTRDNDPSQLVFTAKRRAGVYPVRVEAPGHHPSESLLQVTRGGTHEHLFTLDREQGFLSLETEPRGGLVLIDGADRGSRPKRLPLDTGEHRIRVRNPGHFDREFMWTSVAEQVDRHFVSLPRGLTWSLRQGGNTFPARITGDLDNDGYADLLIHHYNRFRALSPWTGQTLWDLPLSNAIATQPSTERDVDGDGTLDIVVAHRLADRAELVVWSGAQIPAGTHGVAQPQMLWRVEVTDGGNLTDPWVADLNNDGRTEVYTIGFEHNTLTSRDGPTGVRHWQSSMPLEDGQLLLTDHQLFATSTKAAAAYDPGSGTERWRRRIADYTGNDSSYQIVARFPIPAPDGSTQLVVSAANPTNQALVALDNGGNLRWKLSLAPSSCQRLGATFSCLERRSENPKTCMIDGHHGQLRWCARGHVTPLQLDDEQLTFVAARPGSLDLLDPDTGVTVRQLAEAPTRAMFPAAFDWRGTGHPAILFAGEDGTITAVTREGEKLGSLWTGESPGHLYPAADLDGDGFFELTGWSPTAITLVHAPNTLWERPVDDGIRATPLLLDTDADGQLEVAVFTRIAGFQGLFLLDAQTGRVEAHADEPSTDTLHSPLAVARANGGFDLVTLSGFAGVRRYSGQTAKVLAQTGSSVVAGYTSPVLLETRNSSAIVAAGSDQPTALSKFAIDSLATTRSPVHTRVVAGIELADLDGDGHQELCTLGAAGNLEVRSPTTLATVRGRDLEHPARRDSLFAADLTGDGEYELLAMLREPNSLVVLDASLNILWESPAELAPIAAAVIPDSTTREVALVVATGSQGLIGFSDDFVQQWQQNPRRRAGAAQSRSRPVVADVDNNGRPEVLWATRDGSLSIIDPRNGKLLRHYRGAGDEPTEARPVVADVDADGRNEILFVGADRRLKMLLVAEFE